MSGKTQQDGQRMVSRVGAAAQPRTSLGFATILSSVLVLLLGMGLLPASASAAPSSAAAPQKVAQGSAAAPRIAAPSPTSLLGFNRTTASVRVGGQLADAVAVAPKATRTVSVQYRRAGTTRFTSAYTDRTTTQGSFTAYLAPPAAGTWQFRLVVAATARAKAAISPIRTVKASGRATTTSIAGFASTPASITVGGMVSDAVSISPRAARTVEVQARRAGTSTWAMTSSSGLSSTAGNFTAVYRPTVGVWQYRLVVRASATARGAVTSTRTLTASGRTNPPDTTAPAAVTAVSATAATDSSIRLSWVNPSDVDFTGVTIRRQIGAVAPATVTDGTPVAVPASATAISFTDTGLSPLTLYSYALFAHDGSANYSAAATVIGWTTGTPPGPTTAVLSISPPSGAATTKLTVGSPFVFDASLSYAGTGRSFSAGTLDYGDGTASESFTGDSWNWVRNHSYATTGPRTVTLTVTDSAGDIASNVVAITVYSTPTAHLVAQGRPQVGTPVTFDLTSTTPAGTGLTSYSLNVLGVDGTTRYGANGSPLATKEITFTTPGTYEVQFSVSNDAGGSSAIDSVTIDVAGSRTTPVLSVASYGVDTTTITAGGSLFFVATDTYAGPGVTLSSVVLTYGDNTAQMVFTGNQAYWFENHTYDNAGTYPVTLTVTDSSNVTVTKVVTVTVAPAPTAAITIDPNQSSVRVGVPVTFTLTPSTPVGTAITSWTVGGDWWDGGYGTPPPSTLTHTFNTPGTYTVQFEFSNDAQGTAHASIPITVVP